MARAARGKTAAPRRSPHIQFSGGNGEISNETLAERMARLETLMESLSQKLDAQLRRTGEIQAQLDRAINDRPIK